MIELFIRGNQIATYASLSSSGNSNGMRVLLSGVEPLGGSEDVIRVVIRQVNPGQSAFQNGQFVDLYSWPDGAPITQGLSPQHDQFQGRASSGTHQVFTNGRYVIHLAGIEGGTLQFGPGSDPPRSENLSFSNLLQDPPPPPCFVAGTPILTPKGWRDVRALRPGDLVQTLDNGAQPILWRHERTVPGSGAFAPIRLAPGLMGNDAALLLSPQHRLLLSCPLAEMLFGRHQVLVQAQHMLAHPGADRHPLAEVTYVHLLFERHEIVNARGAPVESLHLGPYAVDQLLAPSLTELVDLLPDLEGPGASWHRTVRHCLKRYEVRALLEGVKGEGWPGFASLRDGPPAARPPAFAKGAVI